MPHQEPQRLPPPHEAGQDEVVDRALASRLRQEADERGRRALRLRLAIEPHARGHVQHTGDAVLGAALRDCLEAVAAVAVELRDVHERLVEGAGVRPAVPLLRKLQAPRREIGDDGVRGHDLVRGDAALVARIGVGAEAAELLCERRPDLGEEPPPLRFSPAFYGFCLQHPLEPRAVGHGAAALAAAAPIEQGGDLLVPHAQPLQDALQQTALDDAMPSAIGAAELREDAVDYRRLQGHCGRRGATAPRKRLRTRP
mmetsp:Transcript_69440/g.194734  ORF Transcript_69440/g.194734 Transcript_69440/m.194734 type:complete len:256 (+) Transcript_69440:1617-2384(+)